MNIDDINWATIRAVDFSEKYLENALAFHEDPKKEDRLAKSICKYCFYLIDDIISHATMTSKECEICNESMLFGSTKVDPICLPCAKGHDLCKSCRADIDLELRGLDNHEVEEKYAIKESKT